MITPTPPGKPHAKDSRPNMTIAVKLSALILTALTLWSCSGDTEAFCKATNPVFLKGDDVLSDSTQQEIIANDEARQQLCGRFDGHELFDLELGKKGP